MAQTLRQTAANAISSFVSQFFLEAFGEENFVSCVPSGDTILLTLKEEAEQQGLLEKEQVIQLIQESFECGFSLKLKFGEQEEVSPRGFVYSLDKRTVWKKQRSSSDDAAPSFVVLQFLNGRKIAQLNPESGKVDFLSDAGKPVSVMLPEEIRKATSLKDSSAAKQWISKMFRVFVKNPESKMTKDLNWKVK